MNVNKLKGKFVENGYSVEDMAKILRIDSATLYRKLKNDGNGITIREANTIVKTLKLSSDEAASIFFTPFVA